MAAVALCVAGTSCATGAIADPDADLSAFEDAGGDPKDGAVDESVDPDAAAQDESTVDVDAGGDGGSTDGGSPMDAVVDTGVTDTGIVDTGTMDTGPVDTGVVDTGPIDTGPVDTGPVDTGPVDTGPVDTGPADTGTPSIMCPYGPAGLLTASCPGRYACCLAISVPVDGGSIPLAALCGCQLRVGPLVLGCAPSGIASCN